MRFHDWLGDGSKHTVETPKLADYVEGFGTELSVLDIGTGSGELLRLLKDRGFQNLWGTDIEPTHVEVARQRTGLSSEIIVHNCCKGPPFPKRVFDIVLAIRWLHNYWPAKHAVTIQSEEFDPGYQIKALEAILASMHDDSRFVFDFVQDTDWTTFGEGLNLNGFFQVDQFEDSDLVVFSK